MGIAILVAAGSSRAFWAFAPIFGLGFGALGALMPLLVQDTFGLRAFGTIFGLVNFFTLGAALVGARRWSAPPSTRAARTRRRS